MWGIFHLLFFVVLFEAANLRRIRKRGCSSAADCQFYEVCGNDGKCIEKRYFHCHSDADCGAVGLGNCVVGANQILGTCESLSLESSLVADLVVKVDRMDEDEYRAIPNRKDSARNRRCDNHFEQEYHFLHKKRTSNNNNNRRDAAELLACAMDVYCGNPVNRDLYKNKNQYMVNLDWLVIKNDDWWKDSVDRISEMTTQVSQVYNPVGFFLNSTIYTYNLETIAKAIGLGDDTSLLENFKVGKFDCGEENDKSSESLGGGFYRFSDFTCISAENLMRLLRGNEWNQKGAFQLLAVHFMNPSRLGFGKLPWARLHGMMAFSKNVIAKGESTIQHEFGHGFGLLHVFRGYDENVCQECTEVEPSDFKGDMISDTSPSPQTWACHADEVHDYNSCHSDREWKDLPLGNVMNYGQCRYIITIQQASRMKCFLENSFEFPYTSFLGEADEFYQPLVYEDEDEKRGWSRRKRRGIM